MEVGKVQFASAGDFLAELKKEFEEGDNELAKVAKLKKIEQEGKTMVKFVQEFRKAARESRYEGRSLVEEFKREMDEVFRRKLMEAESPPRSIDQ